MKSSTKVRVKTGELLSAVRAKKAAQDKAWQKSRDEYPEKMERYRIAIVKELRDLADKIERGGAIPTARYSDPGYIFKAERPREYERDKRIERTIKTLEIAAEDSIVITADDYAEYLG